MQMCLIASRGKQDLELSEYKGPNGFDDSINTKETCGLSLEKGPVFIFHQGNRVTWVVNKLVML